MSGLQNLFFFSPTEECIQGSNGADVTESCISTVHVQPGVPQS